MQKKHNKVNHNLHKPKIEVSHEPLHVMLNSPLELRKQVLGGALDLTKMLKTYAELKEIRETKAALIETFYSVHEDIKKLLKELDKHGLPDIKNDKFAHYKDETENLEVEIPVLKEEVTNNEIDKLKAELEMIEKKLNNL